MKLSQLLLPEYDQEMATTRKVLERIPDDGLGWQPHAKSMSLGRLATHIAELAGWAPTILNQASLDLAPPGGPGYQPKTLASKQEILEQFESSVQATHAALEGAEDPELMEPWSLLMGGQVIFTQPRLGVLRSMLFNHVIHHRGQLSVYLRLNDLPVPSIYGPTADEGF